MSSYINFLGKSAIIFLLLDFNISFDILEGAGERLSQGVNSLGYHELKNSFALRIKMADIILLLIVAVQVLSASKKIQSTIGGSSTLLVFFFLYSVTLLTIKSSFITFSQLVVSLIYLTKLCIQINYLNFFSRYFSVFDEVGLLKVTAYTAFCAALVGIFSSLTSVQLHFLMSNRVEYYGQISFIAFLILQSVLLRSANGNIFGINRMILFAIFIVCAVSVLLCGKRTPIVGFAIGVGYLLLNSFRYKKYNIKIAILITTFVLAGLAGSDLFLRTFAGADPIYIGLDTRYSERIQSSDYFSSLSGLDLSTAERIAKILYTFDLIFEEPLGIGFWTSTFQYNFLPDSILQFPLENGLILSFVVLYFLLKIWRKCCKSADSLNPKTSTIGHALKAVLLAMIAMSVTVNIAYMFKFISTFLIFYSLMHIMYIRDNDKK